MNRIFWDNLTNTLYSPTYETNPNGFNYKYNFDSSKWQMVDRILTPVAAQWSANMTTDTADNTIHTAIQKARALYPEASCYDFIFAYCNNLDESVKIALIFTQNVLVPEDWPEPIWYSP